MVDASSAQKVAIERWLLLAEQSQSYIVNFSVVLSLKWNGWDGIDGISEEASAKNEHELARWTRWTENHQRPSEPLFAETGAT